MANGRSSFRIERRVDVNTGGTGDELAVEDCRSMAVEISGTFDATVSVEVSATGRMWSTPATVTEPALIAVADELSIGRVRIAVSDYASGEIVVYVVADSAERG